MRVLLLHPEDFPQRGPWSAQRWDLIVDLGRSSAFSAAAWEQAAHAPVLRTDSFRQDLQDLGRVRELFLPGMGRLVDKQGIDWWQLTSLLIMSETEEVLLFQRMISKIDRTAEIWATRPGWPASGVADLLKLPLHTFSRARSARLGKLVRHYGSLLRRFPARQIKEILLDKYDSEYKWRARFAPRTPPLREPSILLPSAYVNVSRMAAAYARLLPDQSFLLVATRQSGRSVSPPPNVQIRDLAAYVEGDSPVQERAAIHEQWIRLKADLCANPEFATLSRAGVFDPFPRWFQDGLRARDAWRKVLEREPVCGVLCGDDSNLYTRLPVMLAAKRGIPTADFHHGAFDGRYLLKELPSDTYLAKNEMERDYLLRICGLPPERVVLAAPALAPVDASPEGGAAESSVLVFFSEPYENAGMRAEEVYCEVLPRLCRVARDNGRRVIVKLHPFESLSQRVRMVQSLLPEESSKLITVVDGPLSQRLLAKTWFGVTVESTTVLDCFLRGVPGFVCGWLTLLPYGYVQQYGRFGIAQILREASELEEIPRRLAGLRNSQSNPERFSKTAEPETLRQLLGASRTDAVARIS
ncbi:MAG TPA: hypothetical protein VIW68_05480 [Candidatus Sulfotelmatobacter sp.]